MREQFFDLGPAGIAEQAVLDAQDDLRHDLQIAVNEHVERVRDDTLGGVLDGHHAVIRAVLANLGEYVGDGPVREIAQARAESPNGRLVGERSLGSQIGDPHRLLQRESAGHDLAIDRAKRLV